MSSGGLLIMKHIQIDGFSYDPFVIIDFLILSNEIFDITPELAETSDNLLCHFDDGAKYNWLYSKTNPQCYHFLDFCKDDSKFGFTNYITYTTNTDYNDIHNVVDIFMAFDYIYFQAMNGDYLYQTGTETMLLYINEYSLNLNSDYNKRVKYVDGPVKKRWWTDDDEFDRFQKKNPFRFKNYKNTRKIMDY